MHKWPFDTCLDNTFPMIAENNDNIHSWLPQDIFYILAAKMSQRVRGSYCFVGVDLKFQRSGNFVGKIWAKNGSKVALN